MKILTISGSVREQSTNKYLLKCIAQMDEVHAFECCSQLQCLPLYYPSLDGNPLPKEVVQFRETVAAADAVIIATPEYLHNIPAVLKNGLEWLSSSGELNEKRVIAITYTPHVPRGKKAMLSLVNTLQALNANIVVSLELYHTDIAVNAVGIISDLGGKVLLQEAIDLL